MKSFAKVINNKDFNPYAAAYKNMPKFANANHNIKIQLYYCIFYNYFNLNIQYTYKGCNMM